MAKYLKRLLETNIKEALLTHPVIVLTGPRQVGKSTLLQQSSHLQGWRYITLDDIDALEQAQEDPKGLLHESTPTIIDEVQRCPSLLLTIKYLVDNSKRKRKFILSGSENITLKKSPRESLAGRASYLHLTPLSIKEITRKKKSILQEIIEGKDILTMATNRNPLDVQKTIWQGGLPGIVITAQTQRKLNLMASYVDTYISRDIQDLVKVRHPENFRKLMVALAHATGWESRQEELANYCGEKRENVSRHLSLLKETGILFELKGLSKKNERAYRQKKYYWFDSGIACFLSGIYTPQNLNKQKGRYFENLILQQLITWNSLQLIPAHIYYWKRKDKDWEVDFVLKHTDYTIPIEVKSSPTIDFRQTRSIRSFLEQHKQSVGLIVYCGNTIYKIATNVYAVPWWCI